MIKVSNHVVRSSSLILLGKYGSYNTIAHLFTGVTARQCYQQAIDTEWRPEFGYAIYIWNLEKSSSCCVRAE